MSFGTNQRRFCSADTWAHSSTTTKVKVGSASWVVCNVILQSKRVVQEAFGNKFVRTVKVSFITVHEVYAISASTRDEERTHTDVHEDSSIFGI